MPKPLLLVCSLICCAVLNGCTGYRLGSMLPNDIQSVYVPVAINQSDEALLDSEVTRAVLRQLQRDGSLEVTNEESADAVLFITVTKLDLDPLRFEEGNRVQPNEYRMTIRAEVQMIRTSDESVVVSPQSARGKGVVELVGDLTTAKRQAFPEVAEDLAQNIVEKVTEAWPE